MSYARVAGQLRPAAQGAVKIAVCGRTVAARPELFQAVSDVLGLPIEIIDAKRTTFAGYPPTWHWTPWQRRSSVGIRGPAMSANRIRHARTTTRTGPRGSRPSTMRSSRATDHYDSGGYISSVRLCRTTRSRIRSIPDGGAGSRSRVRGGSWRHRSAGGIGGCTPPAIRCASGGPRISGTVLGRGCGERAEVGRTGDLEQRRHLRPAGDGIHRAS